MSSTRRAWISNGTSPCAMGADVEAVSSVQGFETQDDAIAAVEVLSYGFHIGDAAFKK